MATVIFNEQTDFGRSLLTILKVMQKTPKGADITILEDSQVEGIILAKIMEEKETGEHVDRRYVLNALEE